MRRAYPDFVRDLDRLTPEDVVWEPYTAVRVGSRAPLGLSSRCTASQDMWYTTAVLVYDIAVEPHCPHRVMRQFGLRQLFPSSGTFDRITRNDHR